MISNIPIDVQSGIKPFLNTEREIELTDFTFTGGGCINHAGRLKTSEGVFFLKWNSSGEFPSMFEAEAKGLKLLQAANVIYTPDVIGFGVAGRFQFLLLEFIEQNEPSKNYWTDLGYQLSLIHKVRGEQFGLDHNNYIGSLQQLNFQNSSWIEFFVIQRLQVQLKRATDSALLNQSDLKSFELLFSKLPYLLPEESPSLVHGDLWNGNILSTKVGSPCLIDPAVYFGNREADLAMTLLFGGFRSEFYASYEECFPLEAGFKNRADIYNLYPLLVHLNLFGEQYMERIKKIVRAFI
jgi:protein-ribulosamine 3-kinase